MHKNDYIYPGEVWRDAGGKPIQAHGGGILYDRGVYYWYGENKDGPTYIEEGMGLHRVDVVGISCYSSTDLVHWRYNGVVLAPVKGDPEHDLHSSKVVERPKVIFNEKTGQYVMWMHLDHKDYEYARAGVAVSESPLGPFRFLRSMKPHGADSRDMTLFRDDDGKAYLIHSSEWNKTLYISELTEDYLDVTGVYTRNFIHWSREAPALFKHGSRYYMFTSECTGWDPNKAELAHADSVLGPWTAAGNPCVGPGADTTFDSQSTFVQPVAGKPGCFIFMADRWKKENLQDSRYVWLPFRICDGKITLRWVEAWDLNWFDREGLCESETNDEGR